MSDDKIWMPKEIKQKEVIFFHIPKLNIPVTGRQLKYFLPSLILSGAIFFALTPFKSIIIQSAVVCIMLPFIITIIASSPKNGRYLEDIIKIKINYKGQAGIILNEKAVRANARRKVK